MTTPEESPVENETDPRFPSGPWRGFFLQRIFAGKHWMELELTFRNGRLNGSGRDWVGKFVMSGRYDLDSGKAWIHKHYIGKHEIYYQGYNEGKGIWGTWEWPEDTANRGGFHIWPVGLGIDDGTRLHEAIEEPVAVGAP